MARPKKFTLEMQIAAVRSALSQGQALDDIKSAYPNLKEGVAAVEQESVPAAPPPRRRGSGARAPITSMARRPTLT